MHALFESILLGLVEGITEFLPISSTGHLILVGDLIGFKGPQSALFDIVIQFGAILAVCWLFRERLWKVATTFHKNQTSLRFVVNVLIAFLPAAVLGAVFHHAIKEYLFSPYVVCTTLVLGGIIILLVEHEHITPRYTDVDQFPFRLALFIGFCQALAMIPGTSRSGATIIGSLLLKVERRAAAEFSFFLAIPTMFAATVFDLYKSAGSLTTDGIGLIAVGFVTAFLSALVVVRWLVGFVSTHGFNVFGWYRIALGVVMTLWLAL